MNIPNDGGWGKPAPEAGLPDIWQGGAFLGHLQSLLHDWTLLGCLGLTAIFFFGLGLLAARENQPSDDPLWIEQLPPEELPGSLGTSTAAGQQTTDEPAATMQIQQTAAASTAQPQTGQYVASKNGTKYYFPGCAGAKRIKEENEVWFATRQQAEAAGYQPAANCDGI